MYPDLLEPVKLGESVQWVRVRSAAPGNPLLLLIQQGPGLPMNSAPSCSSTPAIASCPETGGRLAILAQCPFSFSASPSHWGSDDTSSDC